jgi:hypothetical protein
MAGGTLCPSCWAISPAYAAFLDDWALDVDAIRPVRRTDVATKESKAADNPKKDPRLDPANSVPAPKIEFNPAIGDDEIDDFTGAANDRDAARTALDAANVTQVAHQTPEHREAITGAILEAQATRAESIHADADRAAGEREAAGAVRDAVEGAAVDDDEPATVAAATEVWNALTPEQRAERVASGKSRVITGEDGVRFDAHTAKYLD